jgi:hypothetical protein
MDIRDALRRFSRVALRFIRGVWSWTSVGWFVALLVGVWGALLGTGDFKTAITIFVLTGALVTAKWATVCLRHNPKRVALLIVGVCLLITGVISVSTWTHSKALQVAKERSDREEQAQIIEKLRTESADMHADLTGGDAYPEVFAQSFVSPMRFKIFNRGKSPLQNISVSISRIDSPHQQSDSVFLGVIPVGGSRDLPFTITPIINADAPYVDDRQIDSWIVEISATNGTFEQRIDFRHTKGCEAVWETRTTFIWKPNDRQSVIKHETDFWSLNLTSVCH